MIKPIEILSRLFNFETIDEDCYQALSHNTEWQRVYGGQIIAQALYAASLSSKNKPVHSLHGFFLLAGDPKQPIIYTVERLRDGRSFLTREVKARQNGQIIFTLTASFHEAEESFDHQIAMPEVPTPQDLPSIEQLIMQHQDKLPTNVVRYFHRERPFEMRPVDMRRYFDRRPRQAEQFIWLRTNGKIDEACLKTNHQYHQAALAYASDFTLLDTALIAHGKLLFDKSLMLASLDHAIWFHRPFRVDEWLLYHQTSPNTFGARGLCFGHFFNEQGELIATTAQEGLTRIISNSEKE